MDSRINKKSDLGEARTTDAVGQLGCGTPAVPLLDLLDLLGLLRPVVAGAAIVCHLAADRRGRRSIDPPRDLGTGEAADESTHDALRLLRGHPSPWHAATISFNVIHCNATLRLAADHCINFRQFTWSQAIA
ncbi:hypothetical protein [Streptomyces sp. NPDC048350]|uniref:hypothetical protein n=1 Tax=Streptomyces sp. NPDC048350 TaxID=3365538 RepID=UPI003711D475